MAEGESSREAAEYLAIRMGEMIRVGALARA